MPLPHGTEVITRVDRIAGERRVPQGSVGRVTRADGDDLDVTVVGVGVLRHDHGMGRGRPHRRRSASNASAKGDGPGFLRPAAP